MHALTCVNHHAYAVLEGGTERDAAALREAIRDLGGLIPEGLRRVREWWRCPILPLGSLSFGRNLGCPLCAHKAMRCCALVCVDRYKDRCLSSVDRVCGSNRLKI